MSRGRWTCPSGCDAGWPTVEATARWDGEGWQLDAGSFDLKEAHCTDCGEPIAWQAAPRAPKPPECARCGSADVKIDAWAAWDADEGRWAVQPDCVPAGWCNACGGEARIVQEAA